MCALLLDLVCVCADLTVGEYSSGLMALVEEKKDEAEDDAVDGGEWLDLSDDEEDEQFDPQHSRNEVDSSGVAVEKKEST